MAVRIERVIEGFTKALEDVRSARIDALTDTKDIQVIQRAFIQHEARRLEKKLGADHPRTKLLKAKLRPKLDLVDSLAVERDLTRIKVPEMAETDGLIHGRVVDEKGRGIGGLRVFVADKKGNRLRDVAEAETDDTGYYSIKAPEAVVDKVAEANPEGIVLTVASKGEKVVHRQRDPVKLIKGERSVAHVRLARKAVITPVRPTRPRRAPAGPRPGPATPERPTVRRPVKKAAKKRTATARKRRPTPKGGRKT